MTSHTVDYSRTEQVLLVRPQDLNGNSRLSGGSIMKKMDELAAIVAMRHAQVSTVTTAAVDNLVFKEAAHENDLLIMTGHVTYTGNTSMEVRVDTYVESLEGCRRSINRAYFVEVVLDKDDRPAPCPKLILQNESEKAEWQGAEKRKTVRMERKKEGF